jgi:hypothetical protein
MHRTTILAGGLLAVLAVAGCGRQHAAGPPTGSGELAAYVMADGAQAGSGSSAQAAPGGAPAAASAQAGDCSKGTKAFRALVFLVSSDTGTPVQQITGDLRAGRSLDDVAGAKAPEVKAQAAGLVQAWLQFAVANGRLTDAQAQQYRGAAAVAIDGLMAADVSACVPAAA